jgi:large subunit ribosomal protein L16
VAKIKAGRVLFEMDGIAENIASEAMRLASHKLAVKTKFIKKDN